jgi:hypothetical protein
VLAAGSEDVGDPDGGCVEGSGVGVPAGADVGTCVAVGAGVGVCAGAGAGGGVVGVTAGGDVGPWGGADVRGAAGEGLDVGLRGAGEGRAAGGEAGRTGVRPAGGSVGWVVSWDVSGRAGTFARPAVAVGAGVADAVAFPASDAVEVTPLGALPDLSALPDECGMSRIPDTAALTTTPAATMTGHCQRGDGVQPVPPDVSHPSSAVNGFDTGSKSVSARGRYSVRVTEGPALVTGDSPLGAEAGSRTVGAVPRGPEPGDSGGAGD